MTSEGKVLHSALKPSKSNPTGFKLQNLVGLMHTKEFTHLDSYIQGLFKDIYTHSLKLQTLLMSHGLEIQRLKTINLGLMQTQKFKEQMLTKQFEENRVLKEQLEKARP